jgi:eukaryotic-like serine/threonine-protein kinase
MNQFRIYIVLFIGLAFLGSCKRKSGDSPLPKSRKLAVYITTDNNNLISYNTETGAKYWEANFKGACVGSTVILKKRLYALTSNGYLYCIDLLDGSIVREINTGLLIPSPSTFENNSLLADNGKIYIAADKLYCYDTLGAPLWNYDPGGYCTTSATLKNGKIFFGGTQRIHCLDLTGTVVWTSAPVGVDIFSSPTVTNGLVYFGADDKKVYALHESDGSIKWQYATLDDVVSSPIVYGGMCLVGSNDLSIHCIDTTTGLKRWTYPTQERVISSPAVHEFTNTVLVGSYDFNLYGINHVTGELKWKYASGSLIKSSPVVYGNYVYFTSFDRYIYCVDVRNGSLVWKQFTNGNCQSSPIIDDLNTGVYSGISGLSKY